VREVALFRFLGLTIGNLYYPQTAPTGAKCW